MCDYAGHIITYLPGPKIGTVALTLFTPVAVPTIAVIGSGLAGGLLVQGLGRYADVTLLERGKRLPTAPKGVRLIGHPLGLSQTFTYGVGGTTNLWRGCMLSMRPDEFGQDWPEAIKHQIRTHSKSVMHHLYGTSVSQAWESKQRPKPSRPYVLDTVYAPTAPFRIAKLRGLKGASVRLESFVESIVETVDGVALTVCSNGHTTKLVFDYVIIAAGAINSPLLLQRSGLGGEQAGLNLTDHPMGMVAKVRRGRSFNRYDAMSLQGSWKKVAKFHDNKTGLWTSFQLCPAPDLLFDGDEYLISGLRQSSMRLFSFQKWKKLASTEYCAMMARKLTGRGRLGPFAFVLAMTEQEARGQGKIRGSRDGGVDLEWQVSERACGAVRRSLSAFEQWLGCDLELAPGNVKNRLWSGAHHAGSCRISRDANSGVVDDNLRVHGASRIFVCDASVLPSTGATNPGLTIGSLALRLASHIRQLR